MRVRVVCFTVIALVFTLFGYSQESGSKKGKIDTPALAEGESPQP